VRVALAAVLVLAAAAPAHAHRYEYGSGSTTAYSACDGSSSLQANGTRMHYGEVANNWLPLGTWIEVLGPRSALRMLGRRFFRVEDRGGPGFQLDFVAKSCGWMNEWGRRHVRFRTIPRHHRWQGVPAEGWAWRCCWPRPRWFP